MSIAGGGIGGLTAAIALSKRRNFASLGRAYLSLRTVHGYCSTVAIVGGPEGEN